MKYLSINFSVVLSVLFFGFITSHAQLADEIRPFDFNNDYYKTYGMIAGLLQDRRNGDDGKSVFDTPTDLTRFSNVRIRETLPAYATDGNAIYWNRYAIAPKESFRADEVGDKTAQIAALYPIYRFPSTSVPGSNRQAALIGTDGRYFEINTLGLGQVINVEFRDRITPGGRKTLDMLAERNGRSVDGTPIIRTMNELKELAKDGLVTLQVDESAPYMVAKVIEFPERGGITPDAFLDYVKEPSGKPLLAETHFITKFECFRNGGICL
jgi:hypothetical protein